MVRKSGAPERRAATRRTGKEKIGLEIKLLLHGLYVTWAGAGKGECRIPLAVVTNP
jgi:hypothetical protein